MKSKRQIAAYLTDQLFTLGSSYDHRCHRIQFKVGKRLKSERGNGGLCEEAFRDWLFQELKNLPNELEGE